MKDYFDTLPMNSRSSLLASPRAAGAATVTRTSSAFTPAERTGQSNSIIKDPCQESRNKKKDFVSVRLCFTCDC